mgnify:CR=1 FL=1
MTTKVRIRCHTCDGYGFAKRMGFVSKKEILVKCPECGGLGWVTAEPVDTGDRVVAD